MERTLCHNIDMEASVYVFAVLSFLSGTGTAAFYQADKKKAATAAKMLAALFFCIAGVIAFCAKVQDTDACAVLLAGLFPAAAGDWFLAKKELVAGDEKRDYLNFALGVISFAVAQTLFIAAFMLATASGGNYSFEFLPLAFLPPLFALISMATKQVKIEKKRLPFVLIYGLFLGMTLSAAASRLYNNPESVSAIIGVVGAAAFVLSDMSLACYYFACKIKDRRFFNFPVMILYFGAQVLYVITMITP